MIEFVFSASPETIRSEPPEFCSFAPSATAGPGSLRIDGILMFLPFPYQERPLSCCRAAELLGRHKVLIPALHSEHVADHLPGNGQRGPVGVPSLQFSGTDHGEFMALPRRQFGCFNQHSLDVLVGLLGDRHPHSGYPYSSLSLV